MVRQVEEILCFGGERVEHLRSKDLISLRFAHWDVCESTSSPLFSSSLIFFSPLRIFCISRCLCAVCAAVVLLEVPAIPV